MAEREDIRDRARRVNSQALAAIDAFDKCLAAAGIYGPSVITTEDMTPDEEEMALFEGFLKEGYPPALAEKKAVEWLFVMNSFMNGDEK
ncbi:MAG: hypothetical protein WC291_08470 [Thermodesulfovibrionales bacterium]|jgi:hypothetical protein